MNPYSLFSWMFTFVSLIWIIRQTLGLYFVVTATPRCVLWAESLLNSLVFKLEPLKTRSDIPIKICSSLELCGSLVFSWLRSHTGHSGASLSEIVTTELGSKTCHQYVVSSPFKNCLIVDYKNPKPSCVICLWLSYSLTFYQYYDLFTDL